MSINLADVVNVLKNAREELQGQQNFNRFVPGLDDIIERTSDPLMLMVMGSFSAGKSSFINALVGEEIAAVDDTPTTAVVTKLCYGAQDKLFLHYRDGSVQAITPNEFRRMTVKNEDKQVTELHDRLDYVERQLPIEMLQQVSIIDSPGLNDVVTKRSAATKNFVSKADTVLWMFAAGQVGTREELEEMDKLTPRLKPIAVINKMDTIDEEEEDQDDFLAANKRKLAGRVQAVVGISAKLELEGQKENNALKRELGNFAELKKTIADLVLPHRERFKLNTLLDELGAYFDAVIYDISEARKNNAANKNNNYPLYIQLEEKLNELEGIFGRIASGIWDYCEREAGHNNEQAQFLLGVLYDAGIGVLQDKDKALQLYTKASLKNHQGAMFNMYEYYTKEGIDETANYWLQRLAEQGLAGAQNAYADVLRNAGKPEEAFTWYEKAAKQGLAIAQTFLALCYVNGKGVNVDYELGKKWCECAAEQEEPAAEYCMGERFSTTEAESYQWHKRAAEHGWAAAQNMLGRYLEEGWGGVSKNQQEAVAWFRKAAEQGEAAAQVNLANCLYNARGCREDKQEAYVWYTKAAEKGIAQAQYSVAIYLEEGLGSVTKNLQAAVKWFRKAAEQGHANAQYDLACYLNKGEGCDKDEEEAYEWLRRAAEQGIVAAQYNLAECLFHGTGCEQDRTEAFAWLRKAAEQGHAGAQHILAEFLYDGISCSKNTKEAVYWYRRAAELGHAEAQYKLAECLYGGRSCEINEQEAYEWYKKAAEQGHAQAQVRLADCLKRGKGCNKDFAEAYKWYRKAAEQGVTQAQYDLAECLYYGEGCEEDKQEAVRWYRKAAVQGYEGAQNKLGMLLEAGEGCERSYIEAYKWFKKAAEQGYAEAQNNLARCLSEGKVIKTNEKKAYEWYEKAAEQGYVPAQINLAICLRKGTGCDVDKKKAIEWYRKAAEKGNIGIKFKLDCFVFELYVENFIDGICHLLFGTPLRGCFNWFVFAFIPQLIFGKNIFVENLSFIYSAEVLLLGIISPIFRAGMKNLREAEIYINIPLKIKFCVIFILFVLIPWIVFKFKFI